MEQEEILLEQPQEVEASEEETSKETESKAQNAILTSSANVDRFEDVYDDTLYFIDGMVEQYDFYPEIIDSLRNGSATLELKKRYMLKAIDEDWVTKIEDCIPALDEVIRKPSKFIEETEKVLPIELSRNISSRSIRHLSQHTDYISKVEDDTITPSKILNVFRDETNKTYENKFINTLINRLFLFVERRYETALKEGKDEKNTSLDYSQSFTHGEVQGKIHFRMEISEEPKTGEALKNYTYTTDLWQRVVNLHHICRAYVNSSFVKSMDNQFVRPPIIRTNAILKNKNLRQCLELWEFIETYENIGYNMMIQENLETIDSRYIKEIYSVSALQYLIFRYNIKNEFESEKNLASQLASGVFTPEIKDELKPLTDSDFNKTYTKAVYVSERDRQDKLRQKRKDRAIRRAIDVALLSDALIKKTPLDRRLPKRTVKPVWVKKIEKTAKQVTDTAKQVGNGVKHVADGAKKGIDTSTQKVENFCRTHPKELERAADIAADIALKAAFIGAAVICKEKERRK